MLGKQAEYSMASKLKELKILMVGKVSTGTKPKHNSTGISAQKPEKGGVTRVQEI